MFTAQRLETLFVWLAFIGTVAGWVGFFMLIGLPLYFPDMVETTIFQSIAWPTVWMTGISVYGTPVFFLAASLASTYANAPCQKR